MTHRRTRRALFSLYSIGFYHVDESHPCLVHALSGSPPRARGVQFNSIEQEDSPQWRGNNYSQTLLYE